MDNITGFDGIEDFEYPIKSGLDLLFTSPTKLDFINPKLDFEINPAKFMEWLKEEDEEVTGDYRMDCASMCEYGSLYILMLLSKKKLKGVLKIVSGNFGFWDHYWISYTYKGVEYFIDLTLKQFMDDAPKLAISLAKENPTGYSNVYYMSMKEYLDEKRAFEFYVNPVYTKV